jgi:hypothetical protein
MGELAVCVAFVLRFTGQGDSGTGGLGDMDNGYKFTMSITIMSVLRRDGGTELNRRPIFKLRYWCLQVLGQLDNVTVIIYIKLFESSLQSFLCRVLNCAPPFAFFCKNSAAQVLALQHHTDR